MQSDGNVQKQPGDNCETQFSLENVTNTMRWTVQDAATIRNPRFWILITLQALATRRARHELPSLHVHLHAAMKVEHRLPHCECKTARLEATIIHSHHSDGCR